MKDSVVVSLLSGIRIVAAFGYQVLWARYFGAGADLDAFLVSTTIHVLLRLILSGPLIYAGVPLFVEYEQKPRAKKVQIYSTIVNIILILSVSVSMLLVLSSSFLTSVLAPGLPPESDSLARELFAIQAIALPFLSGAGLFAAVHYARRKFYRPALSPFLGSLASILVLVMLHKPLGVVALAWGWVANGLIQFVFLMPEVLRDYRPILIRSLSIWRELGKAMAPLVGSQIFSKSDAIVDRFIASFLPTGSISHLSYASQIVLALNEVSVRGLATTRFPDLSQYAIEDDRAFEALSCHLLEHVMFIIGPVLVCVVVFIQPVISLALERGEFLPADTRQVSLLVLALSGVFVGGTMGTILANTFYALRDTRRPAMIGVTGYTLGFCLKIITVPFIGIWGVALATSTYYMFNAFVEIAVLQRMYRVFDLPRLGRYSVRVSIAAGASLLSGYLVKFLAGSSVIGVLAGLIVILLTFWGVGLFVGLEDARRIYRMVAMVLRSKS